MSCLTALVAGPSVRAAARRATLGTVAGEVTLLTALEASVTAGLRLSLHATTVLAVASIMPGLSTLVALTGGLSLLAVAGRLLVAVTADVTLLSAVVTLFVRLVSAGATGALFATFFAGWTVTLVVISLAAVEAASLVFGFAGSGCPLFGAITHQVTNFTAVVARFIIVPGSVLTLLALGAVTLQMADLSASVAILLFLEGSLLLLAGTVTRVVTLFAAVVAGEGFLDSLGLSGRAVTFHVAFLAAVVASFGATVGTGTSTHASATAGSATSTASTGTGGVDFLLLGGVISLTISFVIVFLGLVLDLFFL